MGGQLGYLYIVGPIAMEEGNTMSLPEIPFMGFLIMILMVAGGMIIVAILQKMPAPIRYVTSNRKPYTKNIEKNINLPVCLWDERLSTVGAFNLSSQLDVNVSKREKKIDENAATFILQGAIDFLNN